MGHRRNRLRKPAQLFLIWSGWEGDENGVQSLYLARLKNPWTVAGKRVRISTPQFPWEKIGDLNPRTPPVNPPHVDVNEGPEILAHDGQLFLIYSASGCWTNYYSLGMLTASANGNLLSRLPGKNRPTRCLPSRPKRMPSAPAHNSFFKSPDGKQDWIIYHANAESGQGCGRPPCTARAALHLEAGRHARFRTAVPVGTPLPRPSGEPSEKPAA